MVTFTTTIQEDGPGKTGIHVPEEVMAQLTDARRIAVTVTLNGYSYASTLGWYQGAFKLPVSAEVRSKAGVAGGDEVEVTLEADTAPRVIEPTDDLRAALDADATAAAAWEALSPSGRKAHVASIEGAKAAETRARRVEKAVAQLRGES
jgi:hypothetical protein